MGVEYDLDRMVGGGADLIGGRVERFALPQAGSALSRMCRTDSVSVHVAAVVGVGGREFSL